jgi:hypothetical protein
VLGFWWRTEKLFLVCWFQCSQMPNLVVIVQKLLVNSCKSSLLLKNFLISFIVFSALFGFTITLDTWLDHRTRKCRTNSLEGWGKVWLFFGRNILQLSMCKKYFSK